MDKNLFEFGVQIYGELEKYNDVLSKARCRIFYKYANRNGTYITDEFADKLISSLPYVPVKGIYDNQDNDYTDHGQQRNEGRIYGIVPETTNFAWEEHLDKDGIMRTYACTDVLLFTALYQEATEIVEKAQSMELYQPSLKYHEAMVSNRRFIVFDDGCFLGLQALGNKAEPCFEGASFYTLQNTIEYAIKQIKEYGGTKMPKINFKLSDDAKFSAIWSLLNPEFTEESNWTVTYGITAVYDDYALAVNYETGDMCRVYYKKDDANDMVELGDIVKCYIMDVTETEKTTLDTLRSLNGNTYELVSDVLTNAQENSNKVTEFSVKIEELNTSISTLTTERDNATAQVSDFTAQLEIANGTINSLNEELNSLKSYKDGIETQQKEAVIGEYTEHLSEEILNTYREKISEYSADELDMRLAYELKKANSSLFTKNENPGYVPKDTQLDGLTAILSKYKK